MIMKKYFQIPDKIYKDFETQHHFFFDKASENALFDGELCPMIVLNKGPDLYFLPMTFSNQDEKEKALFMAQSLAYKLGSTHVYFFIEAWFSNQKDVKPSQADDRRETIICVLWVKDIGGAMLTGEMIRNESGELIDIKKDNQTIHIFDGMFTHLCGEMLSKKIRNSLKHADITELFDRGSDIQKKYKDKFKH